MIDALQRALRVNMLAMVSLLIALTSLSYNTWRNEATEQNRNQRTAGFALLQELAGLQLLSDKITYGGQPSPGDRIAGWTRVIFIDDLASLTAPAVQARAKDLRAVWENEVGRLEDSDEANKLVSRSIEQLRLETMKLLTQLR